jgi:hypothetical protein
MAFKTPDDSGHMQRRSVERWNPRDDRGGQEQRQLGSSENDPVDALLVSQTADKAVARKHGRRATLGAREPNLLRKKHADAELGAAL